MSTGAFIPVIEAVPALTDNYAYLVHHQTGTLLIDACEAAPILRRLQERNANLTHILITHDHHDHIGGIPALVAAYHPQVIAPQNTIVEADRRLSGGEELDIGGVRINVLWTPGHRPSHVAFYLPAAASVFSGDALFGAGCGRLFGNPPAMLFQSIQLLAALPGETRVWFGHEYTVANLRFAATIEPDNAQIKTRLAEAQTRTINTPSTIALEKATNPMMRAPDAAEFARRRLLKDNF